jgi:hypothetical protein
MMMGPDPKKACIAESGVLKIKVAELSANEYLMSDFLSWGRTSFRGNHRRRRCSR